MGFIREPKGVDFLIAPSQTAKEDISFISSYIQQHRANTKTSNKTAAQTFSRSSV